MTLLLQTQKIHNQSFFFFKGLSEEIENKKNYLSFVDMKSFS